MIVDSYRFLPRSFRAGYQMEPRDELPVWTPFAPRLADASLTLLTSAGVYVEGSQAPFDLVRERREPTWGDPTCRLIDRRARRLAMAHLHVNDHDFVIDRNVALPIDVLDELVDEGLVGSATVEHVSVMGYQGDLGAWRDETAPEIVERLRRQGTDGVVLAPV